MIYAQIELYTHLY